MIKGFYMYTIHRSTAVTLSLALMLGLWWGAAAAQSEISLEKATNAQDADLPPGPGLVVGDPVTWTYQVTNVSAREITDIEVTDDIEGAVTCPATSLAPGESMTCTLVGTVQSGQYANVGTAAGLLPNEDPVMDTDPSHYFGQAEPSVDLEKSTNGVDADTAPGPVLPVGSTVTWTFEVTNIGTETLTDVQVNDDQEGPATCPAGSLAPGESMTCTLTGTVQSGPYANLGTVTATLPDTTPVADSDPSHHVGQTLVLEKRTEGQDADLPPGPALDAADPVTWTYEVSNPGPETVTNLAVTDDQGVTVTCPQTTLEPRESVTCTGSGTVQFGPYANIGTATAELPGGGQVSDSDPSHYTGPLLRLEKRTNGEDADAPPGPTILVGSAVNWTYEVANFGDSTLTGISVSDDQGVTVTCPQTTLAPGEQMTCIGSGTAESGQYANVGTATAELPEGATLTATDSSHYFGEEPAPAISATKTDALEVDVDNDGQADPGDTLSYTVTVTNDGTADATAVMFSDTPDANTALVAGLVTTSQGSVTTGNGMGDTSVAVDLGSVPVGGTVTITFDVVIDNPVPADTFAVSNQGLVSGDNFTNAPTDDPDVAGTEDPTATTFDAAPVVSASKSAALIIDNNGDGRAGKDDVIRYTIVVENSGNADADGVALSDSPDANTAIVVGSVSTTQGSITSGSSAGDGTVTVEVGTLSGVDGTATIVFDVTIPNQLSPGVKSILNSATITGTNFASTTSDDPSLPGANDPTVFPASPPSIPVPVLGWWALLGLVGLLLIAALRGLGSRQ